MRQALSIKQPWAWAILHGGKDIENRDWKTSYRGKVLIQSGLNIDRPGIAFIEGLLNIKLPSESMSRGAILGEVEIVDCVSNSESPWFFGKYGFALSNPKAFEPRPCKGSLGFFKPDYSSKYKSTPRIGELFQSLPRAPRLVRMKVVDAGDKVIHFRCHKCGHDTGWIRDVWTLTENKRGLPCPKCNTEAAET